MVFAQLYLFVLFVFWKGRKKARKLESRKAEKSEKRLLGIWLFEKKGRKGGLRLRAQGDSECVWRDEGPRAKDLGNLWKRILWSGLRPVCPDSQESSEWPESCCKYQILNFQGCFSAIAQQSYQSYLHIMTNHLTYILISNQRWMPKSVNSLLFQLFTYYVRMYFLLCKSENLHHFWVRIGSFGIVMITVG